MPEEIVIKVGEKNFEAELNDSMTGKAIYGALPIRAKAQRWGGEIYFSIPVRCELEEDPCLAKASQGRRAGLNKKTPKRGF